MVRSTEDDIVFPNRNELRPNNKKQIDVKTRRHKAN